MIDLPPFLQKLYTRLLGWAEKSWEPVAKTSMGRFATDIYLAGRAVVRDFQGENISLRAAALTYISVFSLVPLVTVGLVLLKTLHQEEFQRRMRTAIQVALAPGIQDESSAFLERFLSPANSIAIGSVGFLALLFSAGLAAAPHRRLGQRGVGHPPPAAHPRARGRLPGAAAAGAGLPGRLLLGLGRGAHAHRERGLLHRAPDRPVTTAALAVVGLTLLYYWTPYAQVAVRSALAGRHHRGPGLGASPRSSTRSSPSRSSGTTSSGAR